MQVHVDYQGGHQFQAIARHHRIIADQPIENGGKDAGMTPPEWFLASLGSCVGYYVVQYCRARELDPTDLSIQISAEKSSDRPNRLASINIDVSLPIHLEENQRQGILKAVDACLLEKTLRHSPQISYQLHSGYVAPLLIQ
jgi:uncharacterized OsmC-like protein